MNYLQSTGLEFLGQMLYVCILLQIWLNRMWYQLMLTQCTELVSTVSLYPNDTTTTYYRTTVDQLAV